MQHREIFLDTPLKERMSMEVLSRHFTKDIASNMTASRCESIQEAMEFLEGCDKLDNQWDRDRRENNRWNGNECEGQNLNSNIYKGDNFSRHRISIYLNKIRSCAGIKEKRDDNRMFTCV